jgi:histidinol-phosphate/aromatic aminotransferase/cobyric acid decarboxylase-like protein
LHAIPGLRLGFLLAEPEVIDAVERLQPPWPVNAAALAAGLEALRQPEFAETSRAGVAAARDDLICGLRQSGFNVAPSAANFVLVEVGDAPGFRRAMLEHGYVVRDCTSFGLPSCVRVAIPREGVVWPLAAAMESCRDR